MPRRRRLVAAICLSIAAGVSVAAADDASDEANRFFESRIRPLLASRCYQCHGEKKQEYGLRLDSRAAILAGSDAGDVAVPGKPGESGLVKAVRHEGDIQMPPKSKLNDDEIAAITRWVELGLPWPEGESSASKPLSPDERYEQARQSLWSVQPIRRPDLPAVKNAAWPQSPVDHFVLAKLEAAGLSPSPAVERRTLIRRATFDLHGLPPTPAEVAAFENDQQPGAYERLIDRLLASPRYGERWGRYWLDVARYADTKGYAFGKERKFPFAYTYRDWVIRAFNEDLPYNEFVIKQLAADCLGDAEPGDHAALGFLTVGRQYDNQHDNIDDQIDVVTRGLLGLTVACARCHDHKYDAIPTEDYYSLYGVFASCEKPKEFPLIGDPSEAAGYQKFQEELEKRQRAREDYANKSYEDFLDKSRRNVTEYLVRVDNEKPEEFLTKLPFLSFAADDVRPALLNRWRQYLRQQATKEHSIWMPLFEMRGVADESFAAQIAERIAQWNGLPADRLNPLVRERLAMKPPTTKQELARTYGDLLSDVYAGWKNAGGSEEAKSQLAPEKQALLDVLLADGTPTNIPRDEMDKLLPRAERNKLRELEKAVDSHVANSPAAPPRAMSVVDSEHPYNPQVFIRGNQGRRGDRVPRQFLRLVAGDQRKPYEDTSGRLEMAREIASDENPLTPRVIANRVWMHHFNAPLVATPSDFGVRSQPPTHPEMLDWLAGRLIESGWSLKDLHRQIMLSATYRQASNDRPECRDADAENRLLWRMNRRRLDFEALRDSLLAVSGQLDETMFGRPTDLFTNMSLRRRSVYGFIDRQDLPNLLRTFDFASPDASAERRPQTTVPQQSLFMMNSPFVIAQAESLIALPPIASAEDPAAKVAALYRRIFCRTASEAEVAAGVRFVAAAEQSVSPEVKLSPWAQYAQLLLMTNEFLFID